MQSTHVISIEGEERIVDQATWTKIIRRLESYKKTQPGDHVVIMTSRGGRCRTERTFTIDGEALRRIKIAIHYLYDRHQNGKEKASQR